MLVRDLPHSVKFLAGSGRISLGDVYGFERTDPFAVTGFIRPQQIGGATSYAVIAKQASAGAAGWFVSHNLTNQLQVALQFDTSFRVIVYSTARVVPGKWHFFAVSSSGTGTAAGISIVVVPVGGAISAWGTTEVFADNLGARSIITTAALMIGNEAGFARDWLGDIAQVSVFNGELTLAQVQAIYYRGEYPAHEGSQWIGPAAAGNGTSVADEVGVVTGTMAGATWSSDSPMRPRQVVRPTYYSIQSVSSGSVRWTDAAAIHPTSFTAPAWARQSGPVDANFRHIFGRWATAGSGLSWAIRKQDSGPFWTGVISVNGTTASLTIASTIRPLSGRWYHLALTYNGTTAILYVDGREAARGTIAGPVAYLGTTETRIGDCAGTGTGWIGPIGPCMLFGSVATRAQIEALYYRDRRFATPIIDAPMDEGSGSVVRSVGSHTASGTIVTSTWARETPQADDRLVLRDLGGGMVFGGSSHKVTFADDPLMDVTRLTAHCWFTFNNRTGGGTASDLMGRWDNATVANQSWLMLVLTSSGVLQGAVRTAAGSVGASSTFKPSPGIQYHLALTYDGANIVLYVDGQEVVRAAQTGDIQATPAAFTLGNRVGVSSVGPKGIMHRAEWFGVAATPAQIRDLYYRTKSFGSPIMTFPLLEMTGNPASQGQIVSTGTISGPTWNTSPAGLMRPRLVIR